MPVTVEVMDEGVTDSLLDAVFSDFRHLDAVFSTYREESVVSRINRADIRLEEGGELVQLAASLCRSYERDTGGAFSAWRGGLFDPSGLVKGWAIDRACSILSTAGCRNFYVDGAGDAQTRGMNGGTPWRVGIRHPWQPDRIVRVIVAHDLAVATSGTYEKGLHIVDPRTGLPAAELVSLTVVGPDIVEADVYATAAFAMGRAGLEFIINRPPYEAYAIEPDGIATFTPGFDALCEPRLVKPSVTTVPFRIPTRDLSAGDRSRPAEVGPSG